jgi:hypothetical protein
MLIPIDIQNSLKKTETDIEQLTFREMGLKEEHIEDFIRDNIDILADDQTLLVVGQQVRNKERGRSDLVAVDEDGNLVLIEIKRDLDDIKGRKEPFEFQAIRYAANYARMNTVEELVDRLFAPYIDKNRDKFGISELTANELAKRRIEEFLSKHKADKTFNRKQRIFLVASDFDPQTLSACAWLVSNQVSISCFRLIPYKLGTQYLLRIEQILPLQTPENLYVEVADSKARPLDKTDRNRTFLPRMDKLFEWGIVKQGDILTIKNYNNSQAVVLNHKEVEFQGERLSFNKWGQKVTGWSSICIYEWAYSERLQKLLDDAREEELQKQLNATEDDS